MSRTTRRRGARPTRALAATAGLALAVTGLAVTGPVTATAAPSENSDAPGRLAKQADGAVVAQLSLAPLATSKAVARGRDGEVAQGAQKTRNARAQLAQQRNELRRWLKQNAPSVTITGQFDFALNGVALELNGTPSATVADAPGVVSVTQQQTYAPLAEAAPSRYTVADDPDLDLVDAPEGWTATGASADDTTAPSTWAGAGVRVGIIDSGIDVTHPCFDDTGFAQTQQLGEKAYTNNKVVVAKVFNNKARNLGLDAEAVDSHGTHVAGTVACNLLTPAEVEGVEIPYDPSGVAPGALLGNYNVFPGAVASARSEDILNALDAAAADGMDVLNMSLGGGYSGRQDLLTTAVDNLDRAGIVVAVANGNDGPGYFTGGSPGNAERALTAAASSVGHILGVPLRDADGERLAVAAAGDFPVPEDSFTGTAVALTGSNAATGLSEACTSVPAAPEGDAVALISRGTCAFADKLRVVEAAGYEAAVVVNNAPGDPIAMGGDGLAPEPQVFAVMAPLDARDALVATDGEELTIDGFSYVRTGNDDQLASFSSWGPTRVGYRIKPDVTAPGANVLSSVPAGECSDSGDFDPSIGCWAFFSGTSMATPHLAGMAAVVLADRPGLDAYAVRSAIVNTADRTGVTDTDGTAVTDVQKVGSGLAQLDAAVDSTLALDRPSISFGATPSGSGKTLRETVRVTNISDSGLLTKPVVTGDDGGFYSVTGPDRLDAGATGSYTVTFAAPKGAAGDPGTGFTQAVLDFGNEAHMALFAALK
ncbi:S8 family serine peptidase [Nocardioidaceae bacterium]|nr:S8 family serine peptidase [Nocardioidaceae bacterium]